MRSFNHHLTAVCLLATCAALIFFKSGKGESIDPTDSMREFSKTGKKDSVIGFRQKPTPTNPAFPQATAVHSGLRGKIHPFQVPPEQAAQPRIPSENPQYPPHTQAVQLAENVRLPAALVAQPPDMRDSPDHPVAAARRNIADTFYQEVARKPAPAPSHEAATKNLPAKPVIPEITTSSEIATSSGGATTSDGPVTAGQEDEPLLVNPTPEVDDARHRADETYRALFGDAAYNRQTMNSTVEVNLPSDPGSDPH